MRLLPRSVHYLALVAPLLLFAAAPAGAAVEALFDLSSPAGGPFPSDRFTVPDYRNLTGLRVNLPKPDCTVRVTDCMDIDVINTIDGFNLQPRLSIPFTGPIDVASVSSDTVFLVRLGDARGGHGGRVIGINQVVWDVATLTLHVESDELLEQHTRYLLVVTSGVRDTDGGAVRSSMFKDFLDDHRRRDALAGYRKELGQALDRARLRGHKVVAASVFTTQSATAILEKMRQRIRAAKPQRATIIGTFPLAEITAIQWVRHTRAAPDTFATSFLPTPALSLVPGSVGAVAFGTFTSPDFETAEGFIPAVGTRTGVPAVQGSNNLSFNLILPAGQAPRHGWPVAIFGHGFTDSKQGAPLAVASTLASQGIASIAINVVGHGGGPKGTLTVIPAVGTPVSFSDGGRSIDQDGNNVFDSTEGVNAVPPRTLIGNRDGLRQTVADLMQLVRVIETGGIPGLSRSRIYYAGQSFGGIYGVKLLAVEESLRAGVPNVPGGPIIDIARLSPAFRALVGIGLASRVPALLNAGPLVPPTWGFNENLPLRNLPPVVNTVAGAMEIQTVIENTEWVSQAGNPVAYAPHLGRSTLAHSHRPRVILQFAHGDQTVPNPTTTNIIRAGDLADQTTFYRHDLVRAAIPGAPANPHTFLTNIGNPLVAALAVGGQQQIATFFASDGTVVIDPDGDDGPFFEVPIEADLPEGVNF